MRTTFFALTALALGAHDMWIEPSSFHPVAGQILAVRLRVGQDLLGDPIPRSPELIRQFTVDSAAGRKLIPGRTGADPAGLLLVTNPGLLIIGYHSNPSTVELDAATFNQYLKEEGLDSIPAIRDRSARDQFSRCAKSLVLTGPPSATQNDKALGFPLELVAERNPFLLGAQEPLPLRLIYEGKPLAGALVVAINRHNPAQKQSARTRADGRVRLSLPQSGMWMIKTVHAIPAPAGSGADWSSFWASLTFDRN